MKTSQTEKCIIKISLLFIFITISTKAQEINYFADNPKWRISTACAIGGYECVSYHDYVCYINGDSLIDSKVYKKLYRYGQRYESYFLPGPIPDWCNNDVSYFEGPFGFIRQEQKRIYIRNYLGIDTLLYDFDLSLGDTLPITWNQEYEDIVVVDIDSVLIGTLYRKKYHTAQEGVFAFENQIIEGIGHLNGFIESYLIVFECNSSLNCFSLNDTTYFQTSSNQSCNFDVSLDEVSEIDIKAYPNPVKNYTRIQFDNSTNESYELKVFNIDGKLVKSYPSVTESEVLFERAELSSGLYFVEILRNHTSLGRSTMILE